jgi:hypothetical protein
MPTGWGVLADTSVHLLASQVRMAGVASVLLDVVTEEVSQAGALTVVGPLDELIQAIARKELLRARLLRSTSSGKCISGRGFEPTDRVGRGGHRSEFASRGNRSALAARIQLHLRVRMRPRCARLDVPNRH